MCEGCSGFTLLYMGNSTNKHGSTKATILWAYIDGGYDILHIYINTYIIHILWENP